MTTALYSVIWPDPNDARTREGLEAFLYYSSALAWARDQLKPGEECAIAQGGIVFAIVRRPDIGRPYVVRV